MHPDPSETPNGMRAAPTSNVKYYSRLMSKVQAGGHKAVKAERARIEKLMRGGKVKATHMVRFEEKLNILDVFDAAADEAGVSDDTDFGKSWDHNKID